MALISGLSEAFALMTRRAFLDLPVSEASEKRVHHLAKARRHTFGAKPSEAMQEALVQWRKERDEQQRDTISPMSANDGADAMRYMTLGLRQGSYFKR